MLTREEIFEEYAKCLMDPKYAIMTYLKTFDKTNEGFVPFKLFDKQCEIVDAFEAYRFNLITKPRQAGISTTTQAYMSIKCAWADKKNPETILVIANKLTLAKKFVKGIREYLIQLPRWVWGPEYYGTKEKEDKTIFIRDSQIEIELPNGSKIVAVATSSDALRGYTPTYLIFDEAAFIDGGADLYATAITSLGTGGKSILISTPNGYDPLYYRTYEQSFKGENDYNIIEMRWYQDPRYNGYNTLKKTGEYDLNWVKGEEKVHEKEFTYESYDKMIRDGYSPTSKWYETMCKGVNNDKRRIAQELDVSFLGSGGNVIDDKYIINQEKLNVREPLYIDDRYYDGQFGHIHIWEHPIAGNKYVLAADVARGDGSDSSSFQIINFTTMEQVVEYQGKIPPDLYAEIIYEYGILYSAYVVVDNIGIGGTTALKLVEMKYPDLHYDESSSKMFSSVDAIDTDKKRFPGFNVNGVRLNLVSNLEEMVRMNEIKIRSRRTTNEMRTFIFKNGRPDHMEGYHDDCLKVGTLIKTIDGYKPIEEVEVGELVMTHLGRYRPVEKILGKPFNGDWYDMDFQGQLSLGLSYNHPLYAAPNSLERHNSNELGQRDWILPSDWGKMKNGDEYYKGNQKKPRQISIKENLLDNVNHVITYGDYYIKSKMENSNKLNELILDFKFAKFLGLFLADGHAIKNSKKLNSYLISIAFHVKDEELCLEIENYFDEIGISHHRGKVKGHGFSLLTSSKLLWYILNDCYNDDRDKILPRYSKYLGNDLEYVLDYWLKGDGWVDKRGNYDLIGASTSKSLALSMRDIAWSVGRYAVINKNIRKRYSVNNKDQYWVHIRKDFRGGDRLKKLSDFEFGTKTVTIKKSNYNGIVFNLQVAEDESFIANGIVVHNCLMAMGIALWIIGHSFKKLNAAKEQTKKMLSGWVMPKQSITNVDGGFVPKGGNKPLAQPKFSQIVSKNMQDPTGKYSWLFSGMK